MPFNLLILPLLGGYIFALHFQLTRYSILRAEKERLLFLSAFCGFWLIAATLAISTVGAWLFPCECWDVCIPRWWHRVVGIEYSGVAFGALMLGITAWYPLNWVLDSKFARYFGIVVNKETVIDRVITADGDPFELLIRNSQKTNAVIAVTMKSGKVYIGWITHEFNPGTVTKFISLALIQSGYRHPENKTLQRNVLYSDVIEKIAEEKIDPIRTELVQLLKAGNTDRDRQLELVALWEEAESESYLFQITLPVSEIVSVNLFDIDLYERYFTK